MPPKRKAATEKSVYVVRKHYHMQDDNYSQSDSLAVFAEFESAYHYCIQQLIESKEEGSGLHATSKTLAKLLKIDPDIDGEEFYELWETDEEPFVTILKSITDKETLLQIYKELFEENNDGDSFFVDELSM